MPGRPERTDSSSRTRPIECGAQTPREHFGRTGTPVVEEHDSRRFAGHMLMDRDDIDPRSAQGLEDRLEFRLEHREIPVHHGLRSEEHTSELQSPCNLVCRLLLEKKKNTF